MAGRRGFALLLVLAATLVVCSGMVFALTLLVDARRQLTVSNADDHLRDALAAGERLTIGWLSTHSQRLVLPPEKNSLAIVHERWICEQGDGELTVRVYDACGFIPARCLGANGTLIRALPAEWAEVVFPDLPILRTDEPRDWLETVAISQELRRFPINPQRTRATDWSTLGSIAHPPTLSTSQTHTGLATIASPHSGGVINLNTAPESLLRAAFERAGADGLDEMLQRRRRGLPLNGVPEVPTEALRFRFATTSLAWCAHVTARWNSTQRSWWVVITGNPQGWQILQRHDADR